MCCCSLMVVFLGVVFALYRWKCSQIFIKSPPPNVIINSLNLTSSSPQPFLHRTWKPRCYKTHGKLLPRSHVRSKRIYIKLQCLKLSVMLSSMPLASRHIWRHYGNPVCHNVDLVDYIHRLRITENAHPLVSLNSRVSLDVLRTSFFPTRNTIKLTNLYQRIAAATMSVHILSIPWWN